MSKMIQASIREFARDTSIRKKAMKSNVPIMLLNKRSKNGEEEIFFLLPPKLYDKWYEWYEDMRDAEDLRQAMKEGGKEISLEDLKKELL